MHWDNPVPVVAALHGAVVGGGLELAASCHIRVADETTFYALPEGARGIFVGGGGAVRIPRLIGVARMADMMLTGRVYQAEEGERAGFAQYLVPAGEATTKAIALAKRIALRQRTEAGNEPVVSTPDEFAAFLRAEIAKWAPIIKKAGAYAD